MPQIRIGNFNLAAGRSLTLYGKTVLIYIDEHEMTTSELESLSLSQVAYIKLIPNFMGRGPEAGGGTGIVICSAWAAGTSAIEKMKPSTWTTRSKVLFRMFDYS